MKILVTGAAGFIGMHCAKRLLARGDKVVGVDNLSPYYAVKLKQDRLKQLAADKGLSFHKVDLAQKNNIERLFKQEKPDAVLHLAAQPVVHYSLENPSAYIEANIV